MFIAQSASNQPQKITIQDQDLPAYSLTVQNAAQDYPIDPQIDDLTQDTPKADGLTQGTPQTDGLTQGTPQTGGLTQGTPQTGGLTQLGHSTD